MSPGALLDGASKFGIPVLGILGSVIKVGGNVLNPDVKIADLKRTEEQIDNGDEEQADDVEEQKYRFAYSVTVDNVPKPVCKKRISLYLFLYSSIP